MASEYLCLVLRSPELTQYFRGGKSSAEEKEHLPHPAGKTLLLENQDIGSLLCHKCASLAHVMRAPQAAIHLSVPQQVLVFVIVPHQVQGFTLLFAELPNVSVSSFLQPIKLVLDSSMPLWPSSHACVIGKLADSRLCPIMQITNKDVKLDQIRYAALTVSPQSTVLPPGLLWGEIR